MEVWKRVELTLCKYKPAEFDSHVEKFVEAMRVNTQTHETFKTPIDPDWLHQMEHTSTYARAVRIEIKALLLIKNTPNKAKLIPELLKLETENAILFKKDAINGIVVTLIQNEKDFSGWCA